MSTTPRDSQDDERPTTDDVTAAPPAPSPPSADDVTAAPPAPAAAGAHASPRPYPPSIPEHRETPASPSFPVPPPPSGTVPTPPATPSTPAQPAAVPPHPVPAPAPWTAPAPSSATEPTGEPAPVAPTGAATDEDEAVVPPGELRSRRDVPEPPSKPGIGRHLLAVLLGLLVTPVALLLVGVGIARLADIAGTDDMGTDALGLSLLVGGVVLLAAVVLLGVWSPALPITGGVVWGIGLGVAYLAVPGAMEDVAESMTGDVPDPVDQLAQTAMSGYLVVVGTLLLAAGIAIAMARRRGRRWAEQVAAAERTRPAH